MERKRGIKRGSIFKKITICLVVTIFIQCVLVYSILAFGGIVTRLENNAFDILNEKVINRRDNIEDYMKQWCNLDEAIENIKKSIDKEIIIPIVL